jgi:hypothetical protein
MEIKILEGKRFEITEGDTSTIFNFNEIQRIYITIQDNYLFLIKKYFFVVKLKNEKTLVYKLDNKSKEIIKKQILDMNYQITTNND